MSKTITSPVKRFPGTVDLCYPIPYQKDILYIKAVREQAENDKLIAIEKEFILWGGVRELVEKWDIPNFDIVNPVDSPRQAVADLLFWLVTEIGKIRNEEDDPNA